MEKHCGKYITSADNIYGVGSAGFLALGISKLVSFLILCGYNARNYYIIHSNSNNLNTSPYTKGIVLPIYSVYLYCFLGFTLFFAIIDIINLRPNNKIIHLITTPLQTGIEQCLIVSLSIFMMNYGAGVVAIRNAFLFGFYWGLFTFCIFFMITGLALDIFPTLSSSDNNNSSSELCLYLIFMGILTLFYIRLAFAPLDSLYRRPACILFAKYNIIVNIVLCSITITLNSGYNPWEFDCFVGIILCAIYGVLFPVVIYYTLQLDSQYWSGLETDENNPLKEVWESIDVETAVSVATTLSIVETQKNRKFPLLHFGLLKLEKRVDYVAGGSSRVYFGYLGKQKVALKMLFAMELAPFEVREFYKEACVLGELKHPNIIQCLGVCVMPPALTLVLEYCKYGSLFEFLYNSRKKKTKPPIKLKNEVNEISNNRLVGGDNGSISGAWRNLKVLCGMQDTNTNILNSDMDSTGTGTGNPLQFPRRSTWDGHSVDDSGDSMRESLSSDDGSRISQSQQSTQALGGVNDQQSIFKSNSNSSLSRTSTTNDSEKSSIFRNSLNAFMDYRRGTGTVSGTNTGANSPVPGLQMSRGTGVSVSTGSGTGSDSNMSTAIVPPSQSRPQSTYSIRAATHYLEELHLEAISDTGLGLGLESNSISVNERDRNVSVVSINPFTDCSSANCSSDVASSAVNSVNSRNEAKETYDTLQSEAGFILGFVNDKGQYESQAIRESLDGMPVPKSSRAHYLNNEQKLNMVVDAVRAIAYLHSIGYMHCDIKSLNFLVTSDFRLKLADMGESRLIGSTPKREVPPIPARHWVPPEVLSEEATAYSYTEKSDIFGLALVISEIILLKLPFGEASNFYTPSDWYIQLTEHRVRPQLPKHMPIPLRIMIENAWDSEPSRRPTADEILRLLESYKTDAGLP